MYKEARNKAIPNSIRKFYVYKNVTRKKKLSCYQIDIRISVFRVKGKHGNDISHGISFEVVITHEVMELESNNGHFIRPTDVCHVGEKRPWGLR